MIGDPFDYDYAPEDDVVPTPPIVLDDDGPDGEAEFWRGLRADAEHGHMHAPEQTAIDERETMRRVALTVPCRDCHRDVEQPCVRLDEHGHPTAEPLRKFPAHIRRLNDARRAQRR